MPKSKITVKSAAKIKSAKNAKNVDVNLIPVETNQKIKTTSVVQKAKSTSVALLFWGLLGAFVIAVCWTLITFNRPLFPKQAAKQIAEEVQKTVQEVDETAQMAWKEKKETGGCPYKDKAEWADKKDKAEWIEKKKAMKAAAEAAQVAAAAQPEPAPAPIVIVPEIDTSIQIVANAIVLTDEQKQEKAQEYIIAGVDYLKAGNADLALAEFNSAIALFPSFAPAYVYRGEALFQKTDYAGAMDSFVNAIKLDENLSMAWFDKAVLLIKLGDFDAAFDSINAAIEAFTNYRDENANMLPDELYRKRAQLNLWRKNWTDAIHDYTMASSFAKNLGRFDFPDISGRADAKMGLGDFQGAIKDYDEVIKNVAMAIGRMDDEEEKGASATIAMEAFEKRAAIKLRLGDLDGAKEDLRGAIVLAEAIGDSERKESLEVSLAQL